MRNFSFQLRHVMLAFAGLSILLLSATGAGARDKLPETTPEGLVLQHDTKMAAVYMRPGASLAEYDKIALLKAYVAFKKNWVREHNREEGFEQQLRDKDVKRIRRELAAPDLMTAGMQNTYAASAGQMTLYMELLDGVSGELLYRVIDPEAAGNEMWEVRNKVTNKADADRVLKRWATLLNDHLAKVQAADKAK